MGMETVQNRLNKSRKMRNESRKMRNESRNMPGKGTGALKKFMRMLNQGIDTLDKANLWWVGLLLLAAAFVPIAVLKEGSVFEIHDQMDETLFTYVVNARCLGTGITQYPEMLGGVNASGMQPSAVLFILLYRIFPVFTAFVLQYLIVCACGYFGMYAVVRELTESSLLAVMTAGMYSMLPVLSVYGLSVMGVPLLFYAFLCLHKRKRKALAFSIIAFFGVTTHLVLIGYVVLSFWALAIAVMLWKRRHNGWIYGGFWLLTGIYIAVNHSLFYELILGKSSYVSHREELVNAGAPVWDNICRVFLEGGQHAVSYHKYLILPIVGILVVEGIRFLKKGKYGRLSQQQKTHYFLAVGILVVLAGIAVFYGICQSQAAADFKNSMSGFLRYFQMERYYWLSPSLWYLEAALALGLLWREKGRLLTPTVKLMVTVLLLLPTLQQIKEVSIPYMNINQINNGTAVTGYITWESFYAEDVLGQIDEAIGRDKSTYRIAHLGISPAPSLMYGFYTIDGYSNNYPLEYKKEFRRIIQEELKENEATRKYFDEWGSRCYLFNRVTGTYWMLGKKADAKYEGLELDVTQMRRLGCEYLFSGGEILDAEEMGLSLLGAFESEKSYWHIWVYEMRKQQP